MKRETGFLVVFAQVIQASLPHRLHAEEGFDYIAQITALWVGQGLQAPSTKSLRHLPPTTYHPGCTRAMAGGRLSGRELANLVCADGNLKREGAVAIMEEFPGAWYCARTTLGITRLDLAL